MLKWMGLLPEPIKKSVGAAAGGGGLIIVAVSLINSAETRLKSDFEAADKNIKDYITVHLDNLEEGQKEIKQTLKVIDERIYRLKRK